MVEHLAKRVDSLNARLVIQLLQVSFQRLRQLLLHKIPIVGDVFHAFTVALIVAAFGWAKRKLTAPVIVIEQYFADSPPGRDIFGANVRRLGIRNILHTFFWYQRR